MAFSPRTVWAGIMNAANAFVSTFNEKGFNVTDLETYDDADVRPMRYAFWGARYDNSLYHSTTSMSHLYKFRKDLYRNIRELVSLSSQVVDLYTAKVFPGQIDYEDLSTGAIQVVDAATPRLIECLIQVYQWSNMQAVKTEFVRTGAIFGDVFLKAVDEDDSGRVRIEVLDPRKVKMLKKDGASNIQRIVIEYRKQDDNNKWYTYTETIDQEFFTLERDHKQYDRYPNLYGFVPVVHVKHKEVGRQFGANAFHSLNPVMDEINDVLSQLTDQGRKAVNVLWYFFGKVQGELNADPSQNTLESPSDGQKHARDKVAALSGPKDAPAPFPMVAPIDIAALGGHADRLLAQAVRIAPELALPQIRESGNLTAPGVMAAFADGADRIVESAVNYIEGLLRMNKMVITIGGLRGLPKFEGFGADSFEDGDEDHFIKAPTIIKDQLSKLERVTALQSAQVPTWLILQEMDFDQEIIDKVEADKEKAARDAVRAMTESAFGDDSEDTPDDGTTTDTAKETQKADTPAAVAA